jgi:hypothetical protein
LLGVIHIGVSLLLRVRIILDNSLRLESKIVS